MYWIKMLPDSLSIVEEWAKTIFLLLALLTIAPWAILLLYDLLLYLWRSTTYEIPGIGGRARGKRRPRAPSLVARPDGERRMLGVVELPGLVDALEEKVSSGAEEAKSAVEGARNRLTRRQTADGGSGSNLRPRGRGRSRTEFDEGR